MDILNFINRLIIPTYDDESYVKLGRVVIDKDKCNGCGECTIICPGNALRIEGLNKNKKAAMIRDNPQCMSCNNCQAICSSDAIRVIQIYDYGYRFKTIDRGQLLKPRLF
jgi:ferredoxin